MVSTIKRKTRVTTTSSHLRPQATEPESPVNKFFKVVLPSTMQRNMMMIPARFAKLQGTKLNDVVTLETPVGFKRNIKLKRIGQEIWFQEGWSEFAESHSIKEGHFLFFNYKGNSSFLVIIFNLSACEIEYPLDAVDISYSDEKITDLTEEMFLGTQGNGGDTDHRSKKRAIDIEFGKILHDVGEINSNNVLEEEEDKRVFRGKQFF
ncbi:unnamed protein product [Cochlearia groenlandica]